MASHSITWVNNLVIAEAMHRYGERRLPRSLTLWIEQLLEISSEDAQSSHGSAVAVVDVDHHQPAPALTP
jgi:hypothetical protein